MKCQKVLVLGERLRRFQAAINAAIIEVSTKTKETNCFENLAFMEAMEWVCHLINLAT